MRKIKEVLRLRCELKLGYQQIGRSCAIAASRVHKYLKRAEAAGIGWPLPEGWDEARLDATLFPRAGTAAPGGTAEKKLKRTPPDFAAIHEQLRSSKYVTLQLLWEEYRQANREVSTFGGSRPGTRNDPVQRRIAYLAKFALLGPQRLRVRAIPQSPVTTPLQFCGCHV
jgi:transposase